MLAKEMGFCFGVKRALALVEKAAAEHGSLHTLGAVVHNRQVVAYLESLKVKSASGLDAAVEGAVAVPSHGASPSVFAEAEARGLRVVDATCPMVKAAQMMARQLVEEGFLVVIFGDPDHTEVKGMVAWAHGRAVVVTGEADLAGLPPRGKVAVLSQTTQSLASFQHLAGRLVEERLGTSSQIVVHNTICNATAERQAAALELARQVELMVVVGGRDSANTRRLAELCAAAGVPTHQVESADELDAGWFAGVDKVGITAGASTPDWIVQPVVERIKVLAIDSPARCAGGLIAEVIAGSLAAELGWKPGDRLLAINGLPLHDALDYQYYLEDDDLDLLLERDGKALHFRVVGGEPLGVRFEDVVFDGVRTCRNRCLFCFLRGLPLGMRRGLYLRDDDYRLSAYVGNFVTLTNLGDEDWGRLEQQRLSPLYVSVHATDPDLRRHLLGNAKAPDVMPQLERLASLNITMHAQVVLCPGLNDGAHLDQTIADLAALYPAVSSIGVVPVGLTRHHRPEPSLRRFTPDEARQVVRQISRWQREMRPQHGRGLVYASDEFQLLSGRPLPSARAYDGYPQLGNGIGMVRLLLEDWRRTRRRWCERSANVRQHDTHATPRVTIACGVLVAPFLRQIAAELSALLGESLAVMAVENQFFGSEVTVSGLLTGSDFRQALEGRDLGRVLVLPRASLDAAGRVFLDDLTPGDLSARLGVRVEFADGVRGLLNALDAS